MRYSQCISCTVGYHITYRVYIKKFKIMEIIKLHILNWLKVGTGIKYILVRMEMWAG